ncbi:hypothetical protein ACWGJ6_22920 [Streptomyces canus]
MIRRLFRDWLDGLRAGWDVLWWGQAYPRTLPLRPRGGTIPAYRPRPGGQLAALSPDRRSDDPDEAEALGLTADARRMLTDICFYSQVIGDSKRTILCQPSLVDAVREAVEAHDAGGAYTVRASPACPDGKLLVLDEQAMEASFRQAARRNVRSLYR